VCVSQKTCCCGVVVLHKRADLSLCSLWVCVCLCACVYVYAFVYVSARKACGRVKHNLKRTRMQEIYCTAACISAQWLAVYIFMCVCTPVRLGT
jgi:hypothetical protein